MRLLWWGWLLVLFVMLSLSVCVLQLACPPSWGYCYCYHIFSVCCACCWLDCVRLAISSPCTLVSGTFMWTTGVVALRTLVSGTFHSWTSQLTLPFSCLRAWIIILTSHSASTSPGTTFFTPVALTSDDEFSYSALWATITMRVYKSFMLASFFLLPAKLLSWLTNLEAVWITWLPCATLGSVMFSCLKCL